jgi:hypothetical protein
LARLELAGETEGPGAAEQVARAGVEAAFGLPPGALELDGMGALPDARAKAAAEALDGLSPEARAAAVGLLEVAAVRLRMSGRPGLLVAAKTVLDACGAEDGRLAALSVRGELELAAGNFRSAERAFMRRLASAARLAPPARAREERASLLGAAEAALSELSTLPVSERAAPLARLRKLGVEARERGLDVAELDLIHMTGAALAGRGREARALLEAMKPGASPELRARLEGFESEYRQRGWTAAAETLLAELASASLGEALTFQGGGAAVGASVGLLGGPVGVGAGAGVGYLIGLGLLLAKKGIEGRTRVAEAWVSGVDAHHASETALNAALVGLDFIELGAAVKGAAKLSKGGLRAAVFGGAGGRAARHAIEHSADRLARELAAEGAAALGREALEVWARKALLDAWRDAALEIGLPGMAAAGAVAAVVLAPEAERIAEAAARGDPERAAQAMTGALQLASVVAALAFGEAALMRFMPTTQGQRAAVESALRRVRPSPPVLRALDGAAYQRRLDELSAWTQGGDRARFEAARESAAFFDPVSGQVVLDRARIAELDDAELRGLLAHELTHARLHALDPDVWEAIKAELRARTGFSDRMKDFLREHPELGNASEDVVLHEVLAEAARIGQVPLREGTVSRLGLGRAVPALDLDALRRGATLELRSEGVFARRSAALDPDGARRGRGRAGGGELAGIRKLGASVVKGDQEWKAIEELHALFGGGRPEVQVGKNRLTLTYGDGTRVVAYEVGRRVDLEVYVPGTGLVLREVKGGGRWLSTEGNSAAVQLGETIRAFATHRRIWLDEESLDLGDALVRMADDPDLRRTSLQLVADVDTPSTPLLAVAVDDSGTVLATAPFDRERLARQLGQPMDAEVIDLEKALSGARSQLSASWLKNVAADARIVLLPVERRPGSLPGRISAE